MMYGTFFVSMVSLILLLLGNNFILQKNKELLFTPILSFRLKDFSNTFKLVRNRYFSCILLFLRFMSCIKHSKAQENSLDYGYSLSVGGSDNDYCDSIATFDDGSSVITGYYRSETIIFGKHTLSNTGRFDIFVAKIDNIGNWIWAKSADGTGNDISKSITSNNDGSSVITGYYRSDSLKFGNIDTLRNTMPSDEYDDPDDLEDDIFVAKIDKNGQWLWATSVGGVDEDQSNSIASFNDGSCIITGTSGPKSMFGNIILSDTRTAFIAKIANNGTWLWAKSIAGTNSDTGYTNSDTGYSIYTNSIATFNDYSSVVTGHYSKSYIQIQFGTIVLDNLNVTTNANVMDRRGQDYDIFIAKMDNNGTWLWAKSVGNIGVVYSSSISTFNDGASIITGYFECNSLTFGATTLQNFKINNNTKLKSDIFVAKIDNNGTWLWAKSVGGNNNDRGYSISTLSDDSSILTGYYKSTDITFGNLPSIKTIKSKEWGNSDMFIAKIDKHGTWLWVKHAGGNNSESGSSIATFGEESCIVVGYFGSSALTFGSIKLQKATDECIINYDDDDADDGHEDEDDDAADANDGPEYDVYGPEYDGDDDADDGLTDDDQVVNAKSCGGNDFFVTSVALIEPSSVTDESVKVKVEQRFEATNPADFAQFMSESESAELDISSLSQTEPNKITISESFSIILIEIVTDALGIATTNMKITDASLIFVPTVRRRKLLIIKNNDKNHRSLETEGEGTWELKIDYEVILYASDSDSTSEALQIIQNEASGDALETKIKEKADADPNITIDMSNINSKEAVITVNSGSSSSTDDSYSTTFIVILSVSISVVIIVIISIGTYHVIISDETLPGHEPRLAQVVPMDSIGRVGSLVELLKEIEVNQSRPYGNQLVKSVRSGGLADVMRHEKHGEC